MTREDPPGGEEDAAAARAVWASGDYAAVGRRLQPGADALAAEVRRRLGPGRGRRALDVAAGTGNVAVALARDGWSVLATDLVPEMVERGRARTGPEGLDVAWEVADLAASPVPDGSQDVVASAFGLVFARDPTAAADEVRRVLRPGGVLVLAAWRREGLVAGLTRDVVAALGARGGAGRPGGWDSFAWGEPSGERLLRHAGLADVRVVDVPLPWDFASTEELRRFLGEQSPSHASAVRRLGPDAGADLVSTLVARHAPWTDRHGRVRADGGALVVSARAG